MNEKLRIAPFLSLTGNAEEAMRFYAEHLPGAEITRLVRYGKDHPLAKEGEENNVRMPLFLSGISWARQWVSLN